MMKQIAILMLLVVAGCTALRAPVKPAQPKRAATGTLAVGDSVEITIRGARPSIWSWQLVDAQGRIALPFLGSVTVAGRSAVEARELIEKMYVDGGYYRNPDVAILLGTQAPARRTRPSPEPLPDGRPSEIRKGATTIVVPRSWD